MENKQVSASGPFSFCRKLFKALGSLLSVGSSRRTSRHSEPPIAGMSKAPPTPSPTAVGNEAHQLPEKSSSNALGGLKPRLLQPSQERLIPISDPHPVKAAKLPELPKPSQLPQEKQKQVNGSPVVKNSGDTEKSRATFDRAMSMDIDQRVEAFLKQARLRIRALSGVGDGKSKI